MERTKQTTAPRTWKDRMSPALALKMSETEREGYLALLLQANEQGLNVRLTLNTKGTN